MFRRKVLLDRKSLFVRTKFVKEQSFFKNRVCWGKVCLWESLIKLNVACTKVIILHSVCLGKNVISGSQCRSNFSSREARHR